MKTKWSFFQIMPLKERVTAWHFRLHEKSDDTLTAAKLHPFLPSLGKTPGIYVLWFTSLKAIWELQWTAYICKKLFGFFFFFKLRLEICLCHHPFLHDIIFTFHWTWKGFLVPTSHKAHTFKHSSSKVSAEPFDLSSSPSSFPSSYSHILSLQLL